MFRNLKNIPPEKLMEQSPSLSSDTAEEVAPLSSESVDDPLRDVLRPQPPQPPLLSSVPPTPPSHSIENQMKKKVSPLKSGENKTQRKRGVLPKKKMGKFSRKNSMNVSKLAKVVKLSDNIEKLNQKYSKLGSRINQFQERYNKIDIEHPMNVDFQSALKYAKKIEIKLDSLREKLSQQAGEIEKEIVWN